MKEYSASVNVFLCLKNNDGKINNKHLNPLYWHFIMSKNVIQAVHISVSWHEFLLTFYYLRYILNKKKHFILWSCLLDWGIILCILYFEFLCSDLLLLLSLSFVITLTWITRLFSRPSLLCYTGVPLPCLSVSISVYSPFAPFVFAIYVGLACVPLSAHFNDETLPSPGY